MLQFPPTYTFRPDGSILPGAYLPISNMGMFTC